MVTPLDKAIEKYIEGLPDPVQDIVTDNPTTVRQVIELAATLTESQVKKGKLHRKGDKKSSPKTEKKKGNKVETSKKSRKRKASKNFAVVAQTN
ncbi:hypothetical protein HanIR_Chr06g0293741 [Helianthus annuus]|nr:hypothetical protein HanIR_Chr06g0293741 [Helianthus annuus]